MILTYICDFEIQLTLDQKSLFNQQLGCIDLYVILAKSKGKKMEDFEEIKNCQKAPANGITLKCRRAWFCLKEPEGSISSVLIWKWNQ